MLWWGWCSCASLRATAVTAAKTYVVATPRMPPPATVCPPPSPLATRLCLWSCASTGTVCKRRGGDSASAFVEAQQAPVGYARLRCWRQLRRRRPYHRHHCHGCPLYDPRLWRQAVRQWQRQRHAAWVRVRAVDDEPCRRQRAVAAQGVAVIAAPSRRARRRCGAGNQRGCGPHARRQRWRRWHQRRAAWPGTQPQLLGRRARVNEHCDWEPY